MMFEGLDQALSQLAKQGDALRERYRLSWRRQDQETVHALRFRRPAVDSGSAVSLVAIVGGASAGKSTLFNNLLGGRCVSRIAIRSHTTRGLIVAVHESFRRSWEQWVDHESSLWPSMGVAPAPTGEDSPSEPEMITVVHHAVDAFANVLLVDTPDFTSESARIEGDVTLALLPWFDRLIVVIDHERWFDRQSIGRLRGESDRFGHQRFVVFNRTAEGEMARLDRERLAEQAQRLGAKSHAVLDYRRGRGFRAFPPGALAEVEAFARGGPVQRENALFGEVRASANRVRNENEERTHRLEALRPTLRRAASAHVPGRWDCLTALMTESEREQVALVSRVLGLKEMKDWWGRQTERFDAVMSRMPMVGSLIRRRTVEATADSTDVNSRSSLGRAWFARHASAQRSRVHEAAVTSEFWDEVRRWTGQEPTDAPASKSDGYLHRVDEAAEQLDQALQQWRERVSSECGGVAPHVSAALGSTAIAAVIVLVAVQGPISALTLPAAAAAIGAALGKLGLAAGAGAVAGKPLSRLMTVVREKLLGSPEFDGVLQSADRLCDLVDEHGVAAADHAYAQAAALVLPHDHPLCDALHRICESESHAA